MAREQKILDADVFGGAPAPESTEKMLTISEAELQRMVADQVAKAVAATAIAASGAAPASHLDELRSIFKEMSFSFSEMAHQSDRTHKPIDPKVVAARQRGMERLNAVLMRVREARKAVLDSSYDSEEARRAAVMSVTPKYRIIATVCIDDDLIVPYVRDPGTKKAVSVHIYYAGEPNDAMLPANDIAQEVHAAFRESRGQRSEIERRAVKPAWTTDSGLVIEGGTAPRRRNLELPSVLRDVDLTVPVARDDVDYVRVLGTKHTPFERQHTGDRPVEIEGRYTR